MSIWRNIASRIAPTRKAIDESESRIRFELCQHYLSHAKWPCTEQTVALIRKYDFRGDISKLIDAALEDVKKHLRMWDDMRDPDKRKMLERRLGKNIVDLEAVRAINFKMEVDRRDGVRKAKVRESEEFADAFVKWAVSSGLIK